MRSSGLLDLYSSDLKAWLFEELGTSASIMKYGTAAAASAIIFDAYILVELVASKSDKEISDFISTFTSLQDAMALSFAIIDHAQKM